MNLFLEIEELVEVWENVDNWLGIDPGLKALATLSNGRVIEALHFYREAKEELAMLQKQGRDDEYRKLHNDIKNKRMDAVKKEARKVADVFKNIAFGNWKISAAARMKGWGTAVNDGGIGMFKICLKEMILGQGGIFIEVPEWNTTRTCFFCGLISTIFPSNPNENLLIREWECEHCGALLDRDVNAARNIAKRGYEIHQKNLQKEAERQARLAKIVKKST